MLTTYVSEIFGLWYKSISLGFKYILNIHKIGWSKIGITRLLMPMDLSRYFELSAVYKELQIKKGDKIFDLSSPKLLASYISRNKIVAVDLWQKEIDSWKSLLKETKTLSSNLRLEVVDGKRIPYPAKSFDKVYSISVIEHIENSGDSKAIKEMARILKPNGRMVITVPVATKGYESFKERDIYGKHSNKSQVFWARRYSDKMLVDRIIKPSNLRLTKKIYCYEKYPVFSDLHAKLLPFSVLFGWVFLPLALVSLRTTAKMPKMFSKINVLLVLDKTRS